MEKLFITFKEQFDSEYDSINRTWINHPQEPLGFAARYNPGSAACERKNMDQRDWAYGRCRLTESHQYRIIEVRHEDLGVNQNPRWKRIETDVGAHPHQPIVVDNEPLEGFKIVDFASRYTGNKWIRIRDPRGFELEISVANLIEMVGKVTITNAVIQGKCVWDFGKNGIGKPKLIPVEG